MSQHPTGRMKASPQLATRTLGSAQPPSLVSPPLRFSHSAPAWGSASGSNLLSRNRDPGGNGGKICPAGLPGEGTGHEGASACGAGSREWAPGGQYCRVPIGLWSGLLRLSTLPGSGMHVQLVLGAAELPSPRAVVTEVPAEHAFTHWVLIQVLRSPLSGQRRWETLERQLCSPQPHLGLFFNTPTPRWGSCTTLLQRMQRGHGQGPPPRVGRSAAA